MDRHLLLPILWRVGGPDEGEKYFWLLSDVCSRPLRCYKGVKNTYINIVYNTGDDLGECIVKLDCVLGCCLWIGTGQDLACNDGLSSRTRFKILYNNTSFLLLLYLLFEWNFVFEGIDVRETPLVLNWYHCIIYYNLITLAKTIVRFLSQ